MENFNGFPGRPDLQGYTAVPNMFFDEVLPQINNMSELKILLSVFRKTYGWVKEIDKNGQPVYKLEDSISYSQFEKLTGLSSTSIANGLTKAINDGYLEKVSQGDYTGAISSYRIVTQEKKPQPKTPNKKEIPESKPKQRPVILDDSDIDIKGKPLGISLDSFLQPGSTDGKSSPFQPPKTETESMIEDILGSTAPQLPTNKKKDKEPPNHSKFISRWKALYFSNFNVDYGNFTGKEHGHIKKLLKDYDVSTVLKAMDFYFKNYQSLEGVPSEYPTITIFYSWRQKIIPSSINGVIPSNNKKRNAREFDENAFKVEDDFFDN